MTLTKTKGISNLITIDEARNIENFAIHLNWISEYIYTQRDLIKNGIYYGKLNKRHF